VPQLPVNPLKSLLLQALTPHASWDCTLLQALLLHTLSHVSLLAHPVICVSNPITYAVPCLCCAVLCRALRCSPWQTP
jgi:hypothetical protein